MDYTAYKLKFQSAVHFGIRNLEDGAYSCCADTVYSALCQEALARGADTLQQLYCYAKDGLLLLSDAFPYCSDTYYLPKPMKRIVTEGTQGDSVLKKAYKKLKYIPMKQLDTYLSGNYDVLHAPEMNEPGHFEMKTAVSIRGEEETMPYRIGTYYYHAGNGLYFIAGLKDSKAKALLEDLLDSLSYSGIGGKRTAGFGRFQWSGGVLPEEFSKRLGQCGTHYMSLSVSLPTEQELEAALDGAEYLLCKRSGFVASDTYAPSHMRKQDFYAFQAGSCFKSCYAGDVFDVSGGKGSHPVYRYAKAMLMEIDV